jgi:hypothetical protein
MAGVASVAAAISAADRSLSLVIRFLHWIQKANNVWLSVEMEQRSTDQSNNSSPRFNAT